jgi:Flp pilus assembly pilin Flp
MKMGLHDMASRRRRRGTQVCTGQTLVEYAMILAFVSVVAIGVLMFLGVQLNGVYQTVINALDRVRETISA